jgi:hypothetical protein
MGFKLELLAGEDAERELSDRAGSFLGSFKIKHQRFCRALSGQDFVSAVEQLKSWQILQHIDGDFKRTPDHHTYFERGGY